MQKTHSHRQDEIELKEAAKNNGYAINYEYVCDFFLAKKSGEEAAEYTAIHSKHAWPIEAIQSKFPD